MLDQPQPDSTHLQYYRHLVSSYSAPTRLPEEMGSLQFARGFGSHHAEFALCDIDIAQPEIACDLLLKRGQLHLARA